MKNSWITFINLKILLRRKPLLRLRRAVTRSKSMLTDQKDALTRFL